MLKESGVPLIFTEFTEQVKSIGINLFQSLKYQYLFSKDTQDNLEIVQRNVDGVEVSLSPRRNPFSSLRPVRCTDKTGNYKPNSVIYTNDYISVVKKKL